MKEPHKGEKKIKLAEKCNACVLQYNPKRVTKILWCTFKWLLTFLALENNYAAEYMKAPPYKGGAAPSSALNADADIFKMLTKCLLG